MCFKQKPWIVKHVLPEGCSTGDVFMFNVILFRKTTSWWNCSQIPIHIVIQVVWRDASALRHTRRSSASACKSRAWAGAECLPVRSSNLAPIRARIWFNDVPYAYNLSLSLSLSLSTYIYIYIYYVHIHIHMCVYIYIYIYS